MSILSTGDDRRVQERERGSVDVRALRSHGLTSVEIESAKRLVDESHFNNQLAELSEIRSFGARVLASRFRASERFRADVGDRIWFKR
jgi:hypothetical protein